MGNKIVNVLVGIVCVLFIIALAVGPLQGVLLGVLFGSSGAVTNNAAVGAEPVATTNSLGSVIDTLRNILDKNPAPATRPGQTFGQKPGQQPAPFQPPNPSTTPVPTRDMSIVTPNPCIGWSCMPTFTPVPTLGPDQLATAQEAAPDTSAEQNTLNSINQAINNQAEKPVPEPPQPTLDAQGIDQAKDEAPATDAEQNTLNSIESTQ